MYIGTVNTDDVIGFIANFIILETIAIKESIVEEQLNGLSKFLVC